LESWCNLFSDQTGANVIQIGQDLVVLCNFVTSKATRFIAEQCYRSRLLTLNSYCRSLQRSLTATAECYLFCVAKTFAELALMLALFAIHDTNAVLH